MAFITQQGLKQLDKYKYVAGQYSFLDNVINPFWLGIANFLPLTLAPNMVTFIGFLFIISNYIVMMTFDLAVQSELPNWVFLYASIAVFLYQTLDAVDGKQARRTKSSSPLGQLFDHGCDCFSIPFFVLGSAQAVNMDSQYVFYLLLALQLTIFTSNWNEYHTSVLETQFGNLGVTEGQLIVISAHFVTYLKGQKFWSVVIGEVLPEALLNIGSLKSFADVKIYVPVVYFILIVSITISFSCVINTLLRSNIEGKIWAVIQWIPITFLFGIEYLFLQKFGSQELYKNYAGPILITFGLICSLVTIKLIICSLTKMNFPLFHFEILYLLVVCMALFYLSESLSFQNQFCFFFVFLTVPTVIKVILFSKGICQQISDYLGIYCFSLNKKKKN